MMKKKTPQGYKMYVCKTTVKARSLSEARRISMKAEPDEIWISDDWKDGKYKELASAIGFDMGGAQETED